MPGPAANNRLISYHQTIDLTRRWGSGEIASADGLRFVVPVRSVHAGANPRYFGTGRGVTYFNWVRLRRSDARRPVADRA